MSPQSNVLKIFIGVVALALATASFSAQVHKDKTVHHAAMHAENWVHRHDSPSLGKKKHYPNRYHKKDKSTHHAAMHAENWLKGHASAPHKHN